MNSTFPLETNRPSRLPGAPRLPAMPGGACLRRCRLVGAFLALACVGSGAVPSSAAAQEEAEDRYQTLLDLAFTSASGNQDVTLLTSDLSFEHLDPAAYRLEAGAGARFGRTDGETVAENYRAQVDLAFTPEERWSPFLFAQAEHDPFRRLDVRSNSGAGGRYRFWDAEDGSASISAAVLYSYENFAPDPSIADSLFVPSEQTARVSWRVKGERALTETLTLEHVTFYQPVWDAFDDYLLDITTTARAKVSSAVALTVAYRFERDATPPIGVGRDDRLFTAGVSIEL